MWLALSTGGEQELLDEPIRPAGDLEYWETTRLLERNGSSSAFASNRACKKPTPSTSPSSTAPPRRHERLRPISRSCG